LNNEVSIIGVINDIKESYTKKGKMVSFILDDPSDSIETIVYPSVYQNFKNYIKENEIVIVKGKIEVDKSNEEQTEDLDQEENFKLIATEIYSFNNFINKNNNLNSINDNLNKINPFLNLSIFIEFNPNDINNNLKNLKDFLNFIRNLAIPYEEINKINTNGKEYIGFSVEVYNNDKYQKIETNKYISKDSIDMIKSLINTHNLENVNVFIELINN
jgi:DNA polymerase III alpha subunit